MNENYKSQLRKLCLFMYEHRSTQVPDYELKENFTDKIINLAYDLGYIYPDDHWDPWSYQLTTRGSKKVCFNDNQLELYASEDIGHFSHRVETSPREKVFQQHWIEINKPVPYINNGLGTLGELFYDRINGSKIEINHRDRFVAATIVQWFGSNIGMSFIESALNECGWKLVKK